MIDIHCHILPGLDDGAASMEVAVQMAEMAIADGVTHVIATPHANSIYPFDAPIVRLRKDELQTRLGTRLTISTGCDFHLNFENLARLRREPKMFTLNQTSYLLVEFDDFAIPHSVEQTLHDLQLLGLTPIVTHPERNSLIRSQWDRLWNWMRQGCLVQVTAQSLTGNFGKRAQEAAELLLDANAIHFVASDAHDLANRPLQLKPAFELLTEQKGEEVARALLVENPQAVCQGSRVPHIPELLDWKSIQSEMEPTARTKKKFWFF